MSRLDLTGYLEDDSVEVPGITSPAYPDGKTYRFSSPDAKTGLRLANLADLAVKARLGANIGAQAAALDLDDDQERDLMRDVMGDTLDELTADGVSWVRIQKLNRYLFIHFALGEDAAAGLRLSGEATVPANRSERRAAQKTTPVKSATAPVSRAGSKGGHRVRKAGA